MTDRFDGQFALARYREGASARLGLVRGEWIQPLDAAALGAASLNAFLADPHWDRLSSVPEDTSTRLRLSDVTLTAPVEPRQVLQAGANYRQHVIDLVVAGATQDTTRTPEEAYAFAATMMDDRVANGTPYFFIGMPACVVGDDVPLVLPDYSDRHDWELELAVVIGREAYRVTRDEASSHIAGYTICNDITTRDRVFLSDMKEIGTDWYRSKHSPGFLPTGPFLVPSTAVDGGALNVRLDLNGDTMQDASTSDLLFDIPALIAHASQTMPLLPGDLLLTGSPAGNGQSRGRFLRDGDVMTSSITGLGTQVVHCVSERGR